MAYDSESQNLFFINGASKTIDILNISDPNNPTFTEEIEGGSAQDLGGIVFFDTKGHVLNQFMVGALPDAVTFSPDGTKLIVANEGEPEKDPSNNPKGSVSIIDLARGVDKATVTTADFTAFNWQEAKLREQGIKIFPETAFANDVEPEFIAVVDLEAAEISEVQPLGLKDFSRSGNGLDLSDEDGINIRNEPVFGLYQPDAIAAYEADGETYYVTANEGDARSEDERVEDLN